MVGLGLCLLNLTVQAANVRVMSSALRQKIVSDVRNYSSVSTRAALDSKGRRNVSVDVALWRALDQFDQVGLRAAVDSGADLEVRDQNGLTPLEIVIKWNHQESMGLICSHLSEDSFSTINKKGLSVLHQAVLGNNYNSVVALISCGSRVNLNSVDYQGCTALHYAIMNNYAETARALIYSMEVDVNVPDRSGKMPLHLAVQSRSVDLVKLLIDRSINLDVLDKDGKSPLYYALLFGQPDIATALLINGAKLGSSELELIRERGSRLDVCKVKLVSRLGNLVKNVVG